MIAYTAWDSLRAIAREYDADLTLDTRGGIVLVQRWPRRSGVLAALRDSLAAFCTGRSLHCT